MLFTAPFCFLAFFALLSGLLYLRLGEAKISLFFCLLIGRKTPKSLIIRYKYTKQYPFGKSFSALFTLKINRKKKKIMPAKRAERGGILWLRHKEKRKCHESGTNQKVK